MHTAALEFAGAPSRRSSRARAAQQPPGWTLMRREVLAQMLALAAPTCCTVANPGTRRVDEDTLNSPHFSEMYAPTRTPLVSLGTWRDTRGYRWGYLEPSLHRIETYYAAETYGDIGSASAKRVRGDSVHVGSCPPHRESVFVAPLPNVALESILDYAQAWSGVVYLK